MPSFTRQSLRDRALLWVATGFDEYGDHIISDSYVEIPCRWDESVTEGPQGDMRTENRPATVIVQQDIPLGSLMWKGSEEDMVGTGTASYPDDLIMEVTSFEKVSPIKNKTDKRHFRTVQLIPFAKTHPNSI